MVECKEILEKLLEEFPIEDDVSFNELNISEKEKDHTFLLIKYRELLIKEQIELDRLTELLDKLIGERYKYYRFDDDKEWDKTEIKNYCIPSDRKVVRMKKIIQKQETRVKFFEMCVKAVDSVGWRMKEFLNSLKI